MSGLLGVGVGGGSWDIGSSSVLHSGHVAPRLGVRQGHKPSAHCLWPRRCGAARQWWPSLRQPPEKGWREEGGSPKRRRAHLGAGWPECDHQGELGIRSQIERPPGPVEGSGLGIRDPSVHHSPCTCLCGFAPHAQESVTRGGYYLYHLCIWALLLFSPDDPVCVGF